MLFLDYRNNGDGKNCDFWRDIDYWWFNAKLVNLERFCSWLHKRQTQTMYSACVMMAIISSF